MSSLAAFLPGARHVPVPVLNALAADTHCVLARASSVIFPVTLLTVLTLAAAPAPEATPRILTARHLRLPLAQQVVRTFAPAMG
jgi:hypothetical protein